MATARCQVACLLICCSGICCAGRQGDAGGTAAAEEGGGADVTGAFGTATQHTRGAGAADRAAQEFPEAAAGTAGPDPGEILPDAAAGGPRAAAAAGTGRPAADAR